ncbi:hypothetical protein HN51_053857, partial [Arachis hypogaea]
YNLNTHSVENKVEERFVFDPTLTSVLRLFALILLLSIPIPFGLHNYSIPNADAERDFELHLDGLIHFEKPMNQLPGAM